MNWKLVTKDIDPSDSRIKKLFDDAIASTPEGFIKLANNGKGVFEDTVAMLPRKPLMGSCRICGENRKLTKEHIPPKSSGNKLRHSRLTFDDWIKDKLDINQNKSSFFEQGGVFGYTLCEPCNSFTGRHYGSEYKNWTEIAKSYLSKLGKKNINELNNSIGPFADKIEFGKKSDGAVRPGAFVRQILSCMCSLSGSWNLAVRHPEIQRIILERSIEQLPRGMELGMALFFGPRIRILGPQLRIDKKTDTWRWIQEIAYPPFAFQLILASNRIDSGLGLLIDRFTTCPSEKQKCFTGVFEMGFGWSPYPGDYRSRATIIANRDNSN